MLEDRNSNQKGLKQMDNSRGFLKFKDSDWGANTVEGRWRSGCELKVNEAESGENLNTVKQGVKRLYI